MAHPGVPEIEKGQDEQIQSENSVFFHAKGVVHKEFVPQGQTINAAYYVDVLERLRKRVIRVRKNIAATWVLHLDNVPSHTSSLRVREFLAKHNVATLPQPPYSPDLAPADFFCSRGSRPHSKDAILTALTLSKRP